jgi:hypothetical protein
MVTAIDDPWHVLPSVSNFHLKISFVTPERPIEEAGL